MRIPWIRWSHRWDADRLRDYHARLTAAALAHAWRTTPLWADRIPPELATGRRPVSSELFEQLPTSDKRLLLEEGDRAWSRPAGGPRHRSRSSGSSGEILWLEIATSTNQWVLAHARAAMFATGVPLTARPVILRGPAPTSSRSRLDISRPAGDLADEIVRRQPRVIAGLPHVLVEVGEQLAGRHAPRWVLVGGETTDQRLAAELRRLYGVDPIDTYGSIEVGTIAWQCAARDLYHLHHTFVRVELIGDDGRPVGPGDTGDVVVTGLAHPATPIIRYRLGDRATWADRPCRCGSTAPALASLDGRVHEWFLTCAGRVAPQRLYLSHHLSEVDLIRRYRLTQHESGDVELTYVPVGGPLPTAVREATIRSYEAVLPGVRFTMREVERIDLLPSGKLGQLRSAAPGEGDDRLPR